MTTPVNMSSNYIGFKKETVRLTAETVPDFATFPLTVNVNFNKEMEKDETINGSSDNTTDEYTKLASVEGEISGTIYTDQIGWFIDNVMDGVEVTVGTGKKITYKPSKTNYQPPTFTIFYSRNTVANLHYKASGCAIDEISFEIGDTKTTYTAKIKGLVETQVTDSGEITNIKNAVVPATSPTVRLRYSGASAGSIAMVNGTSATTTLDTMTLANCLPVHPPIKITIKTNLEHDISVCGATNSLYKTPRDVFRGKFECSVETGGMYTVDNTIYSEFLNDTAKHYRFKLDSENAGGTAVDTGIYPKLQFDVSKAIPVVSSDTPTNGKVMWQMSLPTCQWRAEDGGSLTVTLIKN